jgi:hypothetical protein
MSMITLPARPGRPGRRLDTAPASSHAALAPQRLRSELEEDDEDLFGDDDEVSELDDDDDLDVDEDDELEDDELGVGDEP